MGARAERRCGAPAARRGARLGWLHRWAGGTQRLTPQAKTHPSLVPQSFLGDKSQGVRSPG